MPGGGARNSRLHLLQLIAERMSRFAPTVNALMLGQPCHSAGCPAADFLLDLSLSRTTLMVVCRPVDSLSRESGKSAVWEFYFPVWTRIYVSSCYVLGISFSQRNVGAADTPYTL